MPADVVVTHLHPQELSYSFHHSLTRLVSYDRARDHGLWRVAYWHAIGCGSGGIVEGRNKAAREFLEDPDAEWMLSIDSDMGFPPDALDMLLDVADPVRRPIVGGLCFAQKEVASDGCGGFRCEPRVTIFDWTRIDENSEPRFVGRRHYPINAVVRCAGTGMAFLLIHRSVFEKVRADHGEHWFTRTPGSDGELLGEDISFCLRAGSLGFPVHVHTGVKVTHMKSVWLGEDDYWRWLPVPPASEETAVVVPVLHRAHHAAPFMRSLRASTGLAAVYAVVQVGDVEAAEAWAAAGAQVVVVDDEQMSFAVKVNAGYRATSEPWLFIVGSDVQFRPGWLDHAQYVADTTGGSVIGTNDLGNPAVMAGHHATHMLIRRSYVDEQGGSWDPPGTVCHEGYRHWYVDNELVTVAKQRGVWQMAIGSIVEHMHPACGKAENDAVYELGQESTEKDRSLFEWRLNRYGRVRAA